MGERNWARVVTRVAAATPLVLTGSFLATGEQASAGACWPWDARQVQTSGDGTNAQTVIAGRQRLCPNGQWSWWHEETIEFEQFAGYDFWNSFGAVCNNQGYAEWWGAAANGSFGPYQQNCASLRKWEPTQYNVSQPRNVGLHFKWKSGNTGNQFRPIGTVYR